MFDRWSPIPEGVLLRCHQGIEQSIEPYLDSCECGGRFRANASPRCPHCNNNLSAAAATTWIEANAPGTAGGWRWDQCWTGLYCIIIEGRERRDPWKSELTLIAWGETITLFRPLGPEELKLVERAQFRQFPPRLPEQPIFYPVLSEEYAVKIASEWNVLQSGAGYVTRFKVRRAFLSRYQIHNAGGERFQEYWIPAQDLPEFNGNIVDQIEVIRTFSRSG